MSEGGWRPLATAENILVSLALIVMTALPLSEIVLRRFLGIGIRGGSGIEQHLSLIVGMAGAVIAARHNRLLSLSTLGRSIKGRFGPAVQMFTAGVASGIAVLLGAGSAKFAMAEREAGNTLVYGVPVWCVELVMPIGFGLIAIYILLQAGDRLRHRVVAMAIGAVPVMIGAASLPPQYLVVPALLVLLAATVLGVPVFVTLGGVALILFWGLEQPIASIAVDHYSLVTNPSLPTIPLFTLAGYALAESQAPQRLVRVFRARLGHYSGSSIVATVLLCAFFTTFTGASGITILAIGGLMMPILLADGYPEKRALGLVTGAGSLGMLFPPSLPLILYAIIANVPLERMFLGGVIPGAVMLIATMLWGFRNRPRGAVTVPFDWREAVAAIWDAKWELLLPVITMVSLFSGIATPVESAAVTALYAIVIETIVHRDLTFRKGLFDVMVQCGLLVGGVLLIFGVALGFTNYLVDVDFTLHAVDWIASTIHSPFLFLLVLNVWLLVVGCLMEIYAAIIIQVPLLVPLAARFHIDPIRLGIIFLANLEVGYLTPPVGLNLLMSSFRFKKSLPEVTRATWPVALVMLAAVLVITYFPALTTALPNRFSP